MCICILFWLLALVFLGSPCPPCTHLEAATRRPCPSAADRAAKKKRESYLWLSVSLLPLRSSCLFISFLLLFLSPFLPAVSPPCSAGGGAPKHFGRAASPSLGLRESQHSMAAPLRPRWFPPAAQAASQQAPQSPRKAASATLQVQGLRSFAGSSVRGGPETLQFERTPTLPTLPQWAGALGCGGDGRDSHWHRRSRLFDLRSSRCNEGRCLSKAMA